MLEKFWFNKILIFRFTIVIVILHAGVLFAQNPWLSPVKICTSSNGTTFSSPTVFQDSSGVPAVIRFGGDTLIAAFQWFPMPMYNPKWDKIAVKFSYDNGTTWTSPVTCVFSGVPGTFQRPFDPSLVKVPGGIRMFFSDGNNSPPPGGIDTYSAFSPDGINYTFETVRYNDATKMVIDPAVIQFGGAWFYNAWSGTPTDGAYRATSNNGISFTVQPTFTYDGMHLWLGNYMDDGSLLKFYGCGTLNIWFNTSTNGTVWGGYTNTNIVGADPAVVKTNLGNYLMLFTGPPSTASVNDKPPLLSSVSVFPNTFSDHLYFKLKDSSRSLKIEIKDVFGKTVSSSLLSETEQSSFLNTSALSNGLYFCTIFDGTETATVKLIKTQ